MTGNRSIARRYPGSLVRVPDRWLATERPRLGRDRAPGRCAGGRLRVGGSTKATTR